MKQIWYNKISKLTKLNNFEEIKPLWFWCFNHYLTLLGFNKKAVNSLFWDWDMENWAEMHRENSEFKDYTNEQLLNHFLGDVEYCADRMSLDRLFRNHWKFKQVFSKEIDKIKYPNLFK